MDTKASWEVWLTRLFSAASVVALGYFLLFVDFSSHGRIWDKLAARVPALARIIPPAAGSQATVVTKGGAGMENVPVVDRTLITAEQSPSAAAGQKQSAVPVPAAAAQVDAKKASNPHLTSSLTPFNIHDNANNRVISVPAAPAAQDTAQAQSQSAPAAAAAAPESATGSAIAAKASYGAANRSEMMGQAAGPVYNLKGGSKKK